MLKGVLNFALILASFLIALPIWLFIAFIVWIFYHPKIAILILILAATAIGIVVAVGVTWNIQINSYSIYLH